MRISHSTSAPSLQGPAVRRLLKKLLLVAAALVAFCYVAGVTAGYLWLRYGRDVTEVRIIDVALFRVESVRRTLGLQHFVQARAAEAAKNYQAAYISYASGLRQAPDDIPGRLDAAGFFRRAGVANQALAVLEEGLARHPDNADLITATFDYLLSGGRNRYGLDLIRRLYGNDPEGDNSRLLLAYLIRFTLHVEGVASAGALLDKHPELRGYAPVAPVMAQILWESSEKLRAIDMLRGHLDKAEAVYEDFAMLASWQHKAGLSEDAVRTAAKACDRFPKNAAPRVLLIEMRSAISASTVPARSEVLDFLRDFAGRPEAIALLAAASAKKGWVPLNRVLYELATTSSTDLSLMALHYADALARNSRFQEFRDVLAQMEAQMGDGGSTVFLVQLRLRQVVAAAALNESDNVREFARRLAALVRSEPEQLAIFRQFFQKTNLSEAIVELTPGNSGPVGREPGRKAGG